MAVQDADVSSDPYGIAYTLPGQVWEVLKGVTVTGADAGVYSAFADSRLVNRGSIIGVDDQGVLFEANGAASDYVVRNKASGDIHGKEVGIYAYLFTGSLFVRNEGVIDAVQNGITSQGSADTRIDNTGLISGGEIAVYIAPEFLGAKDPKISNGGRIESPGVAIGMAFYPGATLDVWNRKGGTIEGVLAAIDSNGPLVLRNDGRITGAIIGDAGRDVIVNTKKIKGNVALHEGDDVLKDKGKGRSPA